MSCKTCQAQLAAAQAELKDEKTKTKTLGRELDDALRVAHGGSLIQRARRKMVRHRRCSRCLGRKGRLLKDFAPALAEGLALRGIEGQTIREPHKNRRKPKEKGRRSVP